MSLIKVFKFKFKKDIEEIRGKYNTYTRDIFNLKFSRELKYINYSWIEEYYIIFLTIIFSNL